MPKFEGFIAPSYQSLSRTIDCESTRNMYVESVESGLGKDRYALYGRPGNSVFSEINAGQGQGIFEIQNRCFAATGGYLYEVDELGSFRKIGPVGTTDPVSMAANNNQLVVTSTVGGGWLLPLNNVAAYAPIRSLAGGAGFPSNCDSISYMDTYLVATRGGTQEFFLSANDDGSNWSALDFASKEGYPDLIQAAQMVRRQLWVFGQETSEIWWNSGNANFPFQPIQGGLVQVGLAAVRSAAVVGNGLFWLGRNSRGHAVAFAEQNFVPIRVSNHAIEAAWNKYADISDAIGYGYEENGHTFYVLSFPLANATWVLDTKTGFWTEWDWWNLALGTPNAALARFHCFCFGRHLVQDYNFGNVWSQSLSTYTDPDFNDYSKTGVIRRLRRSPHVDQSKHRIRHVRLELDVEIGSQSLDVDAIYSLRYSDDGGFTWGNELIRNIGATGKYANQLVWRQLGSSRDRVYEVVSTSACAHNWASCYLETQGSTEQQ